MSNTSSTKPKILIAALDTNRPIPQYFRDLYGSGPEILAKIKADDQRITDAGYEVTELFFKDADPQAGLDWLDAKLRKKKLVGVMIGSGLRSIPEQTVLFEQAVNVVRRASPESVFVYSDGPGGNYDALMRNKGNL